MGCSGRTFRIWKFRTMTVDADERKAEVAHLNKHLGAGEDPRMFKIENDPRVTRVGRVLRHYLLDELPQLINVFRGDMSIVGPRPERPEYVSEFQQTVYRYGDRHRVKSGITGWAQVHGLRGRTSLADRAEWDNFYIENFSLWLDLKIALKTVGAVFGSFRTVE